MKAITWKHGLGALLICVGVGACTQETADEAAQAPAEVTAPEPTTAPPVDTGTPPADPYATTPVPTDAAPMTSTDISGTETTGDTLGDRCAGFTGEALTECLEMETARRQDVQPPSMQDPTETPPQDVPQQ